MTGLLALLWANRRLVGIVMVAIFVLAAVWWFGHSRYAAGEAAGRAHVQTLWDAEAEAQRAAVAAAEARVKAKEASDRKAAEDVEREMQTRLLASDYSNRTLAGELSNYQRSLSRCRALSDHAGTPPGATDSAPEPDDGRAVEAALADHLAACGSDATRLAGWQQWWSSVSVSKSFESGYR